MQIPAAIDSGTIVQQLHVRQLRLLSQNFNHQTFISNQITAFAKVAGV